MLKRLGSLDGQDNLSLSDKVAIARGEDLDLVRKLTASGDFDAAIEACEPLTLTNPDALEVLIQLAKAVSLEGRHADAESLFSKAVFVCSSDPALLRERGINLFALKRYSDALKTFAKAMAIQPRNPSIVFNMGNAFGKLGQLAEANQCYELAALLEPTCPKIQNNRGNNYWRLKKYYESIECFDKAIALDPGYALAHNGKGVSLKALSHLYDAGEAFHKALTLDPDMADAHLNLGFVHLTLGDYIEGLRLYEWRRRVDRLSASFKHYPQPYLTPDCSLSDKVLFLYPEQGLGDFIQFMRFIPELLEQDSSVVLQTPRSLTQLVRAAFPRVSIIESDALPSHFDAHCSVVSLPYVLQTTPENISGARYLTADPEKIALWQEKLGERQGGRVGIVWSGNIDHKNDHNRSVALSDMLSIIDPSFEWHSLQVQYREDDEVTLSENPLIQDHRAELTDFSETAALIECMDLVITVDTSVAHLAGALGKPVWILVPKVPDFRWMMDSSETIWYDSARLYRQPVEGDWQTVFKQISSDLPLFLNGSTQQSAFEDPSRIYTKSKADLLVKQGVAHHQSGDLDAAKLHYERALVAEETNVDALQLLGLVEAARGSFLKAFLLYTRAHTLTDLNAPALVMYGVTMINLGRYEQAVEIISEGLQKDPSNLDGYKNRATALERLGYLNKAACDLETAFSISPDDADTRSRQGAISRDLHQPQAAISYYEEVIRINPQSAEAYNNMGTCYADLGFNDRALECFNKALSINSNHQASKRNKALVLLSQGQFLEGWKLFESRLYIKDGGWTYPSFKQPLWRGDLETKPKRLLIYHEQGYGDFIQFCRFIPELYKYGAEIVLAVPPELAPLAEHCAWDVNVVTEGCEVSIDAHCPIMSLPYVLQTTPENISGARYLTADPEKIALWQEKLGERQGGRVGIVWSGNIDHKNDHNRSVALSDMLSIIDPSFEWHSLQVQYREDDEVTLSENPLIQDHRAELTDFSETAALIECMDLVITVDTSVAHLAGALGKPVWILVPKVPDFRWMMDSSETIWYDSARLYRQPVEGDWQTVIERIESDLTKAIVLRNH